MLTFRNVLLMGDKSGQFAPYPGGGGCFDYDAVFILTIANSDSLKSNLDFFFLIDSNKILQRTIR